MRNLGVIAAAAALLFACGGGGDDDDGMIDAAAPPDAAPPDAHQLTVEWPSSPDDYAGEIVGYAYEISFPAIVDDVPSCCKDFGIISRDYIEDGTNNPDNGLARLAKAIEGTVDFQAELNLSIQEGELAFILDHRLLDGDPDEFVLAIPYGTFAAGTSYAKAMEGTGDFILLRDSFVEGTGRPKNVFNPSTMSSGMVVAGPAKFEMLLPFGTAMIPMPVSAAEITGNVTVAGDGVSFTDAEVTGYFRLDDLWGTFNEILLRPECACLGISEPVYVEISPGVWDGNCIADAETRCALPEEGVCVTFSDTQLADGICGVGPAIFGAMADIDLDDDPDIYEAVSVGLTVSAVPAKIVGVEPAN